MTVPNIGQGAVSGFGDEQLSPKDRPSASTLAGSTKFDPSAHPQSDSSTAGDNSGDNPEPTALDAGGSPLDFTVEEINAYLGSLGDDEAGSAERQRILDAELARDDGKDARVSINGLEAG